MPTSGGPADKHGNRYETLWTLDQVMQLVDGSAARLIIEPLDPDESRGIEFTVDRFDGTKDHWSVKRQTTKAAGWTLSALVSEDDRGRSILGDLFTHVELASTHRGVFASALGAHDLVELQSYAATKELFDERMQRSAKLKGEFMKYVMPICGNDSDRARELLLRTRAYAIDELQLRDRVDFAIRKLFYMTDGSPFDAAVVRGYLSDLLFDNLHKTLDRNAVLMALASKGILQRDWANERSVRDRVSAIRDSYLAPLNSQLISGMFLTLPGSEGILDAEGKPASKRTLVVAGAGGGKSSVLANVAARLTSIEMPVLPMRFDQLPDGVLSTAELGRKQSLPESPTLVLAGISAGRACALIIDQLDAVSIASGRRTELWSLFEDLLREADRFPNMYVLIGCREFDLDHDHRMRSMKARESGYSVTKIQPLTQEQIDSVITDGRTVPTRLKPVLTLPLHLSMFLSLPKSDLGGLESRDDLFDHFWTEKERRTNGRLGRPAAWSQIIEKLTTWLSNHEQLSAPTNVLDEFPGADVSAMASEHVLTFSEGRYRFFHESFFDYAFARRFVASGKSLVSFLLTGEQHLFRRAQVRQVLVFLRSMDRRRYLTELEDTLVNPLVRFHIKRVVFQWLSALSDPTPQEWDVLSRLLNEAPDFRPQVRRVLAGSPAWFDVLDGIGFLEAALSSGDAAREQEAVWLMAFHETMKARSVRVAALLRKHRRDEEPWGLYLRHICRMGDVYHSRDIFELFLSLIDDGTLDELRPGFAVNDGWWNTLYGIVDKRPDMACEAIGRWLDRAFSTWRRNNPLKPDASTLEDEGLWEHLDRGGNGASLILKAAESGRAYVSHVLPRVASYVAETTIDFGDSLQVDPLWTLRYFGDDPNQTHTAILSGLAQALESLSRSARSDLDRALEPYLERPHNTITYLILRAWTAAPEYYADRLADYLAKDSRRLKVGYSSWSGYGGSARNYTSIRAVRAVTDRCSDECFASLEKTVLGLNDQREARIPQDRGRVQLGLLTAMDKSRLSNGGKARMGELLRKFPIVKEDPPVALRVVTVGSPIPIEAQLRMTDTHWLSALRKYAGVDRRRDHPGWLSGGQHQLAQALQARATVEPARFAALAMLMSDELPATYFDAIVRGVAECLAQDKTTPQPLNIVQVSTLIQRVHALPNRPCGRSVAWLIQKWSGSDWSAQDIDAIGWYAMNDPDPGQESWRTEAANGQPYYGGDPYSAGMNSTRGAAALAVARLLFDKPDRFPRLATVVQTLAQDPSIAVRSCAIETLLATLNNAVESSIQWFNDCVAADPVLLGTQHVEDFIHHAGYRNYDAIRPTLEAMFGASDHDVVEAAARQVCLLALTQDVASKDSERVRTGSEAMRKSAAAIYSTNVADDTVGPICRESLKSLFSDRDEGVRTKAASAFNQVSKLAKEDQADMLRAFLAGGPGAGALEPVIAAIEESSVQMPDLVCQLVEVGVKTYRAEAGDISKAGAMVAGDLSKITVRLYAQTDDVKIRTRCLDAIDEMERHDFYGLSNELRRLDR